MFNRIRVAFALAILVTLLTSITAFAKGDFSFITITGAGLKGEVRVSDPALTTDFFAFADLFRHKTEAPTDPGIGYEITRYYLDGKHEMAFDSLIYYPDTGFVYYDGIVNGWSEYDNQWYTARPEIKAPFQIALSLPIDPNAVIVPSAPKGSLDQSRSKASILENQAVAQVDESALVRSLDQTQAKKSILEVQPVAPADQDSDSVLAVPNLFLSIPLIAFTAGLAVIAMLALRMRRLSTR